MKRLITSMILAFLGFSFLPQTAHAAQLLIPVGKVVGLELRDDSVTVAAFDDTLGVHAKDAGLQIGDEILKIDETQIDSAADVRAALSCCDGDVELVIDRKGKQHKLTMIPQETPEGQRLGVYLRQGIAGIGTVTYYDPETGVFGALGHGVSNSKGSLVAMTEGNAYHGRIHSVAKGKAGSPGQLRGGTASDQPLGPVQKNSPQGVFGTCKEGWIGQPLPVAAFEDVCTGEAQILSTISGDSPREYSVEILKIYPKNRSDNRNFLIRVTDPDLLAATGGIVQGMSGSPIIQDGKLIGAVTHVLVNDPQTGYGIFIENMLEAAG